MSQVKAYGTISKDDDLKAMNIQRRNLFPRDIEIEILYCGVCHSDLHTARNDWGSTKYPAIPGHEIVGKVTAVGPEVTKFKIGDIAAIGCMIDSCRTCDHCMENLEQYCEEGFTGTYNGKDRHTGAHTLGGYSERIVADEHYVLHVPSNLDPAATAPLLCAGITCWSPLRHWNVNEKSKVAIIGLGGLGHMAIKLAKGLGAEVTLFSRSPNKTEDALRLGADYVIISTEEGEMNLVRNKFDIIIDTVPYEHDVNPYMQTLGMNGTLVLVGFIGDFEKTTISTRPMIYQRRSIAGSLIGGIAETQEMLDFCGEKNIVADIEMINIQEINKAYERMLKSDVKYRFVIDMASLNAPF